MESITDKQLTCMELNPLFKVFQLFPLSPDRNTPSRSVLTKISEPFRIKELMKPLPGILLFKLFQFFPLSEEKYKSLLVNAKIPLSFMPKKFTYELEDDPKFAGVQ